MIGDDARVSIDHQSLCVPIEPRAAGSMASCDGKLVGLVCDEPLFMKPTEPGRAYRVPYIRSPASPNPGTI